MRNKIKDIYIESDYERLHTRLLGEDLEIDKVLDVRSGCIYETKTITSGSIREVEVHPLFLKKEMPEEWRRKETKEARKKLNNKNAQKYFIRKINTNFNKGDYYLTLVYTNKNLPKDHDRARKDIHNYILRLNRKYKKQQIEKGVPKVKCETLKYVYVTEYSKVKGSKEIRCHHHVILNSVLSMEIVESEWKLGRRNNIRKLEPDELGLTGIAIYLSKDPKGKKRWCCSKNLKEPFISRNISKFSKKKINHMVNNQNSIKDEMEKVNPGYIFIDSKVFINEYNGKPYIYSRMRKIN